MLDNLLTLAANPAADADLRRLVEEHIQSLRASAGRGDGRQVGRAEAAVRADPNGAFTFDATGRATLTTTDGTWQAGHFETPSIGELRGRVASAPVGTVGSAARLWVLDGASPVTDIGSLQATAGEQALFQVASQFN